MQSMNLVDGVKLTRLDNGLTVLTKEIHLSPLVSTWMWYKVGSRNEKEGITGCSHWVEHMLFKGGKKFKKGDIFKQVSRLGGYNNGFTSNNHTVYLETLPSDAVELALEIEADRMAEARFDPAETASERTVIISEREGSENNPQFLLQEELLAAAFRVHSYRWPVVGHKCDLEQMTREELYAYYREYYGPNNAMLVLVGDFNTGEILEKVKRIYGGIKHQAAAPPVRAVEPPQMGERRIQLHLPGNTNYLMAGYHVPAANDPAHYSLFMLDAILTGAEAMSFQGGAWMGRSSRLNRALVDSGLAAEVGSNLELSPDPSLYSFWATVREGVAPPKVEKALLAELERISLEPPSEQELEKALHQIRAQFAYSADGVSGQAFILGYFANTTSLEHLGGLLDNLAKVTPEQVRQAAQTYLQENNRTIGWFIPTETGGGGAAPSSNPKAYHRCYFSSSERSAASVSGPKLPVERYPLSCGGVLLVCPNANTPTVSLRGSLLAGSTREKPESAGLAVLTSRLLMRGTEQESYQEIADKIESRGASLSFGTGMEQSNFSAKCLADDVTWLLAKIADCWRNPIFPSNEIKKVRSEMLTEINEQRESTRDMAELAFRRALYPAGSAFGRGVLGEPETVKALTRRRIIAFHDKYYDPGNLILVVSGAVDPGSVRDGVEKALSGWKVKSPSPLAAPAFAQLNSGVREIVAMPHKSQADIALGFPAVLRSHPDFYAAALASSILGRLGLMGRLGATVRDKEGLAYYVFSQLHTWNLTGYWLIQGGINPKNIDQARESIWREIKLLTSEPVSEEELASAKSNKIGALALQLETNEGLALTLQEIEYHRLGVDFLAGYPDIIRALTAEQLLEVAQRYLTADKAVEVVAGPE
jgi:zinc protease